ncbi:MAG: Flp pilus assembly complex ATPase component TadA [Legionella sp.]|nr:Flp pilus assembly complex ATPase component TadA [Legionella sp.]
MIGNELTPQGLSQSGLTLLKEDLVPLYVLQEQAKACNLSLPSYLIRIKNFSALQAAETIAQAFALPFFQLHAMDASQLPWELLDERLIMKHRIIPIAMHHPTLKVAIAEPKALEVWTELQFHTGCTLQPVIVEVDQLDLLLKQYTTICTEKKLSQLFERALFEQVHAGETTNNFIPQMVELILNEAIKKKASDIHFEPYEAFYRIRFRLDGILYTIATPPKALAARITACIKVMAQLDISEKRLPQDGRFTQAVAERKIYDLRVSTCPTLAGEKIVIRILNPEGLLRPLDELGLSISQKDTLLRASRKPQGLILVTGSTGSGKTTTLYSLLQQLNEPTRNVITAEDPIEIQLDGINQVNVNLKSGLTFAHALRAFLRQDPDVILLGEIRDRETADMAVNAAQTGHLVLSTLHTNSAAETLNRLLQIGVAPYNIASALNLIVSQRLVRTLCNFCKEAYTPNTPLVSEPEEQSATFYRAQGCPQCHLGFQGRTGIFEVLPITPNLMQLIVDGVHPQQISQAAQKEGMIPIFQSGMSKVAAGITTIEELYRVTIE